MGTANADQDAVFCAAHRASGFGKRASPNTITPPNSRFEPETMAQIELSGLSNQHDGVGDPGSTAQSGFGDASRQLIMLTWAINNFPEEFLGR
jgi:hypothetical protein